MRFAALLPLLFTLGLSAQVDCNYHKTPYLDWSKCGETILPGTPLGDVLGVNEGTVIPMQQPNGTRKLSIRVYLYASDSAHCPFKSWWIEGGGINPPKNCN